MAYIPKGAKGIQDADAELCSAQPIPTDGADDKSDDNVDLQLALSNAGGGNPIRIDIVVTTAITVASGTSSKLEIVALTSDDAADTIGGCTEHSVIATLEYSTRDAAWPAIGFTTSGFLPANPGEDYLQFLHLALRPVGDDTLFSAGAIDAFINMG